MRLWLGLIGLFLSLSTLAEESAQISDNAIRDTITQQSIQSYPESCPCPYNRDEEGNLCGRRSEYYRQNGASPECYQADVSNERVKDHAPRF